MHTGWYSDVYSAARQLRSCMGDCFICNRENQASTSEIQRWSALMVSTSSAMSSFVAPAASEGGQAVVRHLIRNPGYPRVSYIS